MDLALEIRDLTKRYDRFTLDNVSFSLPRGSIMGLIGENGAGKTTTLKLILNLLKRDSGNIRVLGLDNIRDEKKIKEQIGVVFDESYFHDNLMTAGISSIMKNIFRNWNDEIFFNYMKKFGLPDNKPVREFSRGMKLKLSIAAALSHDPTVLILDEATSGLDPIVRSELLDVFLEFIQDEKKSILFSSHITSDLEKIADYVTFIHEGKIIFSESKVNLLDSYGLLRCGADKYGEIDRSDIVGERKSEFGCDILVRDKERLRLKYGDCIMDNTGIEDIMLMYVRGRRI